LKKCDYYEINTVPITHQSYKYKQISFGSLRPKSL